MVKPEEPKTYPLVSDDLFEAKVKLKSKKKKVELDEDDLPMNQRGKITQAGRAPKVDPKTYQTYNSMTDAKDPNWIQGAEDDIERRGTEGKCTPITKKGCTGKAKALAKTFKKMAKKRGKKDVNETFPSDPTSDSGFSWAKPGATEKGDAKLRATHDAKVQAQRDANRKEKAKNSKLESTTAKPIRQARARAQAGKPLKKGTAKMVASDPGQDLDTAKKAGAKL